jgi:chaperonin GroES
MSEERFPVIPAAGKIIVRRLDAEAITDGGIVIPDSAKQKELRGIVVSVGPMRVAQYKQSGEPIFQRPFVKEGNVVCFASYVDHAQTVRHDGEDLLLMDESDVLAIFTDLSGC